MKYNTTAATITIPKRALIENELIAIPRKEYETLVGFKRIREFQPSAAFKHALKRARDDYKKGKFITPYELKRRLGIEN